MNRKYSLLVKIGLNTAITSILISPIWVNSIYEVSLQNKIDRFGEYAEKFLQNSYGAPYTLDVKNPINVVINEMNDEAKQNIKNAIESIDNISENINYNIYSNNNVPKNVVNYIDINLVENFDKDTIAGRATFNINNATAKINYPISIDIKEIYTDSYWDNEYMESALTTIVKHELLHTLGFDDVKSKDSIMYYDLSHETKDLTNKDIEIIQYIYDNKKVATTYKPTKFILYDYTKENDEELVY